MPLFRLDMCHCQICLRRTSCSMKYKPLSFLSLPWRPNIWTFTEHFGGYRILIVDMLWYDASVISCFSYFLEQNFHLINTQIVLFCLLSVLKPFFTFLVYKVGDTRLLRKWWLISFDFQLHIYLPSQAHLAYIYFSSGISTVSLTFLQIHLLVLIFDTHSYLGLASLTLPYFINMLSSYWTMKRTFLWARSAARHDVVHHFANILLLPSQTMEYYPFIWSHNCSFNSCFYMRNEVEKFKNLFNERLKFVSTKSLLVAYYASFVPIVMTAPDHEFDHFWAIQHVFITWLCTFFMLTSHLYSPQFYDTLHRSSLHLGKWVRLEARNSLVPYFQWIDSTIYGPNTVVRHAKEYYKSEANFTCAEPGNRSHTRFFVSFNFMILDLRISL